MRESPGASMGQAPAAGACVRIFVQTGGKFQQWLQLRNNHVGARDPNLLAKRVLIE